MGESTVPCGPPPRRGGGWRITPPFPPPLLRVPGHVGITMDAADLARSASGRYEVDFEALERAVTPRTRVDRKSTRLNSSHDQISYAVFCLKKKKVINCYRPLPIH